MGGVVDTEPYRALSYIPFRAKVYAKFLAWLELESGGSLEHAVHPKGSYIHIAGATYPCEQSCCWTPDTVSVAFTFYLCVSVSVAGVGRALTTPLQLSIPVERKTLPMQSNGNPVPLIMQVPHVLPHSKHVFDKTYFLFRGTEFGFWHRGTPGQTKGADSPNPTRPQKTSVA